MDSVAIVSGVSLIHVTCLGRTAGYYVPLAAVTRVEVAFCTRDCNINTNPSCVDFMLVAVLHVRCYNTPTGTTMTRAFPGVRKALQQVERRVETGPVT